MKKIKVSREPRTREWKAVLPNERLETFREYLRECRLPCVVRRFDGASFHIRFPAGFSVEDLKDTLGHFLDGYAELEIDS